MHDACEKKRLNAQHDCKIWSLLVFPLLAFQSSLLSITHLLLQMFSFLLLFGLAVDLSGGIHSTSHQIVFILAQICALTLLTKKKKNVLCINIISYCSCSGGTNNVKQ